MEQQKPAPAKSSPARQSPQKPAAKTSTGPKVDLREALRGKKTTAEALRLQPADSRRFVRLAAGMAKASDFEACAAAAELAVGADPRAFAGWVLLGMARAKLKNYTPAVPCYLQALALQPADIECWVALGELYIALNEFKKAADALKQALLIDPKAQHPCGRRARALIGRNIAMLRK